MTRIIVIFGSRCLGTLVAQGMAWKQEVDGSCPGSFNTALVPLVTLGRVLLVYRVTWAL